jgi:hypothetical protein
MPSVLDSIRARLAASPGAVDADRRRSSCTWPLMVANRSRQVVRGNRKDPAAGVDRHRNQS